jgi:YtcA-like protein
MGLAGCTGAPSENILGSYFPSWMLCVLAGIGAAILVRQGLVTVGIDKALPAPLLVYLAFTVFFAFAIWLAWLG